jgi:hypothetical protein
MVKTPGRKIGRDTCIGGDVAHWIQGNNEHDQKNQHSTLTTIPDNPFIPNLFGVELFVLDSFATEYFPGAIFSEDFQGDDMGEC